MTDSRLMRVRRFFIDQFPLSQPEFKSYNCSACGKPAGEHDRLIKDFLRGNQLPPGTILN